MKIWLKPWLYQATVLLSLMLASLPAHSLSPLQIFIDATPPGGTLKPPPGTYEGPITIRKPITLDGEGRVTIDAGGKGTVLNVLGNGITVRNVRLTNSGESHDSVDAGIYMEGFDNIFEDSIIDNCLFGMHLSQARLNTLRNNHISSKPLSLNMRGDGIRLWYSSDNRIQDNTLRRVRDVFLINSPQNLLIDNDIAESSVGIQLTYSPGNLLDGNRISKNSAGVVLVYSNNNVIRNNQLQHLRSAAGSAFAIKESSQVVIENNEILHCGTGILANSPIHPENTLSLRNNRFVYNDIAMYFYGEKGGHTIQGNRFEQNLQDIAVTAASSARDNLWRGNYWDRYEGFDRDGDGIGDQPHEIHLYSDRLWMDRPMTRIFRGAPLLELIDFIERLAPFTEAPLILRDPAPLMH